MEKAEVGVFGITWREGMINCLGELHGGFAGVDPFELRNYMGVGLLQSLRVSGTGENGEAVEYLLWPDNYGRQRCQKFTDGLYTMPPFITSPGEISAIVSAMENLARQAV